MNDPIAYFADWQNEELHDRLRYETREGVHTRSQCRCCCDRLARGGVACQACIQTELERRRKAGESV